MAKTVLMTVSETQSVLTYYTENNFFTANINKKIVIGRQTENNNVDIDLGKHYVSRCHGEFNVDNTGTYYTDLNSTNGTYYNGNKLYPHQKQYLKHGDVLHIFNGTPRTPNDFICFIFSTNYFDNVNRSQIDLHNIAEVNIGRGSDKKYGISDSAVSENHATFFIARDGWAVTDHNSMNGVFINNKRINCAKYLRIGDCVRIVNSYFIYTGASFAVQQNTSSMNASGQPEEGVLDIHIAERSVWQRTKKLMLLQNINITINSGEMVLILGGSGAGKTTFMNAVMGYEKAEGHIVHDGVDIYEDFESMKYKIGFVPQQDLLRPSDTVYDTLNNAAEMKMNKKIKRKERKQRIEEVLETLGLQPERNKLVSKLSGGQRKRLSIAVEYIADPNLFFLDEPDSGLDGIMAKTLMQNLRNIANEGKIVMVISHAPDRAAELFDKIIVLAKSPKDNCGHLAFWGTVSEALEFFEVSTLEDVVRRINRKDEGGDGLSDHYIEKYNNSAGRR